MESPDTQIINNSLHSNGTKNFLVGERNVGAARKDVKSEMLTTLKGGE